jgi:hypothetical protein
MCFFVLFALLFLTAALVGGKDTFSTLAGFGVVPPPVFVA